MNSCMFYKNKINILYHGIALTVVCTIEEGKRMGIVEE